MKNVITSNDLNNLSASAMELLGDVQDTQRRYDELVSNARDLGLTLTIGEKETDTAFMRRIALSATELEHDLAKTEAVQQIREEQTVEFSVRRRPKSFLGRTFTKLARAIG